MRYESKLGYSDSNKLSHYVRHPLNSQVRDEYFFPYNVAKRTRPYKPKKKSVVICILKKMRIFAPMMKALEKIFKYVWMSVGILLGIFVFANILFIAAAVVYTMLQGILMK